VTRLLLAIGLTTGIVYASSALSEQRVVMRFAHECVHLTQETYYEAPMENGKPDFAHGKVYKMLVDQSCGVNEVKREFPR
jgi:hypothetical protein